MTSFTRQQGFERQTSTSVTYTEEVKENKGNASAHKLRASPPHESSVTALKRDVEQKESKSCSDNATRTSKCHSLIESCITGEVPSPARALSPAQQTSNDGGIEKIAEEVKGDFESNKSYLNIQVNQCADGAVNEHEKPDKKPAPHTQMHFLDGFWSDDDEEIFTNGIFNLPLHSSSFIFNNLSSPDLLVKEERKTTPHKFEIIIDAQGFKPEEIKIKTSQNRLLVHAKTTKSNGKSKNVFRELKRDFQLPDDVNPHHVTSHLMRDGNLLVEALRKIS